MTSVFPMEIYIYLVKAIYAVSIMRTCSLPSHWDMDFIPRVCMWMFYILRTFVYIIECTWLDLYRISLSNVSLFKHSSSFWIPCSKATNIEIREGREGNIKDQIQFLFLPVVLSIFTSQCFMLLSELLSKEQAEHTDFKTLFSPKHWSPCVSGRFQFFFFFCHHIPINYFQYCPNTLIHASLFLPKCQIKKSLCHNNFCAIPLSEQTRHIWKS